MAQRTGLEPATPGVTGRYSNRLNYRCVSVGLRPMEPYCCNSCFIWQSSQGFSFSTSYRANSIWEIWRSGRDSNPRPPA